MTESKSSIAPIIVKRSEAVEDYQAREASA